MSKRPLSFFSTPAPFSRLLAGVPSIAGSLNARCEAGVEENHLDGLADDLPFLIRIEPTYFYGPSIV